MVYDEVGSFASDRDDLHIDEETKERVISNCMEGVYSSFGAYNVEKTETIDGFKYYLSDNSWVMIRPSGTEPVLRVYAEAPDSAEVRRILDATGRTLAFVKICRRN